MSMSTCVVVECDGDVTAAARVDAGALRVTPRAANGGAQLRSTTETTATKRTTTTPSTLPTLGATAMDASTASSGCG